MKPVTYIIIIVIVLLGIIWYFSSMSNQAVAPIETGTTTTILNSTNTTTTISQAVIKIAQSAKLGEYLTDGNGQTLYIFKNDKPDQSLCTGACATKWPAFEANSKDNVSAVGATGTIAVITRSDNISQVTYNGHPLYYWTGDKNMGDTTGQGIQGVWTVAKP